MQSLTYYIRIQHNSCNYNLSFKANVIVDHSGGNVQKQIDWRGEVTIQKNSTNNNQRTIVPVSLA